MYKKISIILLILIIVISGLSGFYALEHDGMFKTGWQLFYWASFFFSMFFLIFVVCEDD